MSEQTIDGTRKRHVMAEHRQSVEHSPEIRNEPKKRARFRARERRGLRRQPATGNRQPATGNRQPATGNRQPATGNRRMAAYLAAPPSNQAASFTRSSSVMCVTLPIGIAFRRTACS